MTYLKTFLLVAIFLSGCGGGSGSAPSQPVAVIDPNLTVPVQVALSNLTRNGFTGDFTISGYSQSGNVQTPITGTGTLTLGAGSPVVFNSGPLAGRNAYQQIGVTTVSSTTNGKTSTSSGTTKIYTDPSTYTSLAVVSGTNNLWYSTCSNPSTVKAGDTGLLGNSSDGQASPLTTSEIYLVSKDSATSLIFTVIKDTYSVGHIGQTKTAYRIDTSGNIKIISIMAQKDYLGSVYQNLVYTFN